MKSNGQPPLPLIDRALSRQRECRTLVRGKRHFLLDRVAEDLADRLSGITREFNDCLDLSPRAGAVASEASRHLASPRWVHAPTAIAPGSGLRSGQKGSSVSLAICDEEWLPFSSDTFDLVVSGLGLHRANDLPGVLLQINRALRPDGLFLASLFGGGTLGELRAALMQAETEISGGVSPRVMPFAEVSELGGLMQRAGFALPVADVERVTVRYSSVFGLFDDLRSMGESNVLHARSRKFMQRGLLMRAAEIYAERFADADGKLRATFDIVTLTGWHPHKSQQQPLKPGSAKTRLADALGTSETNVPYKAGGKDGS